MADIVTLTCPSCGAALQVTNDVDRFACAHCGVEHVVKRAGGLVSLAPVVAELRQVRIGVDKTAAELALPRLTAEIAALERQKRLDKITYNPGWWVYLIALVLSGLTMAELGMAIGGDAGYVCGPIAGVIVLGLVVLAVERLWGGKAHDAERARQEHNARVEQEIRQRQAQIDRYRKLLSE